MSREQKFTIPANAGWYVVIYSHDADLKLKEKISFYPVIAWKLYCGKDDFPIPITTLRAEVIEEDDLCTWSMQSPDKRYYDPEDGGWFDADEEGLKEVLRDWEKRRRYRLKHRKLREGGHGS